MFIYLIRCEENSYYKIGITKNIQKRIKEIQTGTPDKIYLIDSYESEYARQIEIALHNFFKSEHRNNEWFELSIKDEIRFKELCILTENNLKILKQENDIL